MTEPAKKDDETVTVVELVDHLPIGTLVLAIVVGAAIGAAILYAYGEFLVRRESTNGGAINE